MRSLADVIQATQCDPESGLSDSAIAASRDKYGKNALTPLPRESIWKKFFEKFDEPIIKILLAAALLSMVVDLFKASTGIGSISFGVVLGILLGAYLLRRREWAPTLMFASALGLFLLGMLTRHFLVEGLAVMIAVILATGVAFASEYRSDREFEILNAQKKSIKAKVLRSGKVQELAIEDVVVGDVVVLEAGDEIPADGRLHRAHELTVDQSLMTGESEPAEKAESSPDESRHGPDEPGCVYRGTHVVGGAGRLLVTDVGDCTALGQIARHLAVDGASDEEETEAARVKRRLTMSKELTPLQQKLQRLAKLISKVGYSAAILIFFAQLARGIWIGEVFLPRDLPQAITVVSELLAYFVTMVIIVVIAVPEGLPMSVTLSLAMAMRQMTRANSLVRQLVACETVGSATVICSDKTGTLTQNKMQVDRVSWGHESMERLTDGWKFPTHRIVLAPLRWLFRISAINSTASLAEKDGKTVTIGNSTEGALLGWLRESGINYHELRKAHPHLYQIHFCSERKRMTTVVQEGDRVVVLVKGAPEVLVARCRKYLTELGTIVTLDDALKQSIEDRLRDAMDRSMRTLAFAYAELPAGSPSDRDGLHAMRDALEDDLVYVGFVAIHDPLRADVKDAIDDCRSAGIEVKMITGDNPATARAIGHELGLIARIDEPIDEPGAAVITSAYFNKLDDDALKTHLPKLRILARAQPLDKLRMVRLLQELGEVVAVTGDGTNDAPALKRADVGLSMGIAGTEVSKEASNIVLLDDSFSTIVKAVQWGRSLYENIQRFIQFQLTINVSALAITFLGILLFGVKAPFTVLQLLWINVIMDTLASMALCSEPPRPEVMTLSPKRRDENILTPVMIRTIFLTAVYFIVIMLGLLLLMRARDGEPGFLGGNGPWAVEVGGATLAVPQDDPNLRHIEGDRWEYKDEKGRLHSATPTFTIYQASLFFSIYVFFQVWNQINARSLTPEESGFHRLLKNRTFIVIASIVAVGQIVIVTFGGSIFKVERLGMLDWLGVIAFTSSVLVFAEIARRIRLAFRSKEE